MTTFGPRTRSASFSIPADYIDRTYNPDGSLFRTYDGTRIYKSGSDVMHDVVTENFKSRVAAGEIINNPMDHTVVSYTEEWPNYQWNMSDGKVARGKWPGILTRCPFMTVSVDYTTAKEVALTKAYAKVDSSVASLPVTLGELKETKEMLFGALLKLKSFHKVLKYYRDKLKYALDNTERIAFVSQEILDSWMAVRFGWLPFVSDLRNIETAMRGLTKYEQRQTFRAGETLTFQDSDIYTFQSQNVKVDFTRTFYEKVNISAGVLCKQRYGGVPDTWGLTKIPGVIWELTRLSWAIDYFFNVADVIASFTPDTLWDPATSWITVRSRRTETTRVRSSEYFNDIDSGYLGYGGYTRVTTYIQRYPNPGRNGINFRPKLNWARYIDLVGVLKSPLKKTLREAKRLYNRYQRRR